MTGLVDTHAHLDALVHDELGSIMERAAAAGVGQIITVGSSLASSRQAVAIAGQYRQVSAAVGIHPHDCGEWPGAADELRSLVGSPEAVAIGEIGLDYHYPDTRRQLQSVAFDGQLTMAAEAGLPVIIHCRDAYDEMIDVIRRRREKLGPVVIHCYSGTSEQAMQFLAMDCLISFAGQVTFKNRGPLEEAVRLVPLERLLLETDCPYLAPHPKRGTPNEPANVALTAQAVADIKGVPLDELARVTTATAAAFFGLGALSPLP